MTTSAEIARLQGELDELRQETRANDRTLAVAIRKTRLGLTHVEQDNAVRRLRQPTYLLDWHPRPGKATDPNVQGGLVDRLKQGSPVADSFGNDDATSGSTNVLLNPTFDSFNAGSGALTLSPTYIQYAPGWKACYILNSGAVTTTGSVSEFIGRVRADNPVNSSGLTVAMPYGNPASDVDVLFEASTGHQPSTINQVLPYFVVALKVIQIINLAPTLTALTVQLEIVDDTAGGAVVATSTVFDLSSGIAASGLRMSTAVALAGISGHIFRWRLRVKETRTAVVGGAGTQILIGEPQAHQSWTIDPIPYAPLLGKWQASTLEQYGTAGDTQARLVAGGNVTGTLQPTIRWGSGTATPDIRLLRNAAKVLTFDDGAGGRAALEGVAGTGPGTPSTGLGRLYFSSATKTWHGVSDAGVDTDLAGAGSQVSNDTAVSGSADYVAREKLAADTTYRVFLGLTSGDAGSLEYGAGGVAARDIRLARTGAGQLKLDVNGAAADVALVMEGQAGGRAQLNFQVSGDTQARANLRGDAISTGLTFGPGGASALDVSARRTAAGQLTLDSNSQAVVTQLVIASTAGQSDILSMKVSGDTFDRVQLRGDATVIGLDLGPGGASGRDFRWARTGAKAGTVDDTAGGNVTLNVKGTLQQSGTGVSVIGHGPADHADVTRTFLLTAMAGTVDSSGLNSTGASPNFMREADLADAATQGMYWTFIVPPDWASGVISVQPVWSPGSTDGTAHTVRWQLTTAKEPNGTNVTTAGTTVTFTGASAARTAGVIVFDTLTSTTLTPGAAGELWRIAVHRLGADAADTYVGVVKLHAVIVSYTANQ